MFTAGYARKEAQVHADMRLVRRKKIVTDWKKASIWHTNSLQYCNEVVLSCLGWRRTITTELAENHLTLGEAQNRARDRLWWKQFVAALCPTGGEEE